MFVGLQSGALDVYSWEQKDRTCLKGISLLVSGDR